MYDTGLAFWKSPRRKLFAVRVAEKIKLQTNSDSDEEEDPVVMKSSRKKLRMDYEVGSQLIHEVQGIKSSLVDVLSLTNDSDIPLGFKHAIRDAFQCIICKRVPLKPPVIISKCCKSILGCERCINNWYSGSEALTKNCPKCGMERGYPETMLLLGLDSFLSKVAPIIQNEDEKELEDLEEPAAGSSSAAAN